MNGRPYTVLACGRPLRVAFLVDTKCFPPESDRFHPLIDAIVDWCNTHWGGRTNHICFFSGDGLSESEWSQLEIADPDSLVAFAPLKEKLILELNDRITPYHISVEDLTAVDLDRIHVSLSDCIDTPPTPLNLNRIKTGSSFGAEAPPQLLLFDFAKDCDSNVRKFVHRNFGTYYQWFDPRSGEVRRIAWLENLLPKIPTHSLTVSSVSSLAAALTEISGRLRRGETKTGLRHIAPYQLASVFMTRWPSQELRNRFQLIIGDSAEDFSEHWNGVRRKQNWSHTHRHQLWVPSTLLSDEAFRGSLHDWVCAFANAGSGDRVEILSHSLSERDLSDLQMFFRKHELPIGSDFIPSPTILERAKRAYIEAEENTKFFPWSTNDNVQRCTAFSAHEVLALEKADPLDPDNPEGSWMVDLQIEHVSHAREAFINKSWWHIPRSNSGGAVGFLFKQPARITRSGRFTIHVQKREGGIAQRLKPELKLDLLSDYGLIRSFITEPRASPFFTSDARNNTRLPAPIITGCEVSTKGRYLNGLIDLFGDFWTAKTFCERRFWRGLFNQLASHRGGTGEKLREKLVQVLNQRGDRTAGTLQKSLTKFYGPYAGSCDRIS